MAVPALVYPARSRARYALSDTYLRRYIPGTTRKYARGHHYAIDIAGPAGTRLYAPVSGVLRNPHWGPDYGRQVIIVTRRGHGFFLAHNLSIDAYGSKVYAGEFFAKMDSTGQVTGSHSHEEWHPVWYDWRSVENLYVNLERARQRELATRRLASVQKPYAEVFEYDLAPEGPSRDDIDAMLEENHDWFDQQDSWHRTNLSKIRRRARAA